MVRSGVAVAAAVVAVVGVAGTALAEGTWSREEFPGLPDMASYVSTVSSGGGATWALGSYSPPGSPTSVTAQGFRREESGRWVEVAVPNIGQIVSSAVTGPDNAWAVSSFTKVSQGATMHWDGKAWTEVPVEVPDAPRVSPSDVAAVGPDVWAIGNAYRDGQDPISRSFAVRWVDGGWQGVALPPEADEQLFASIGGAAPDDIWMAGTTGQRPHQIVSMHWDGLQWSHVPVPPVDTTESDYITVHDVAAFRPDNVWISATQTPYDTPRVQSADPDALGRGAVEPAGSAGAGQQARKARAGWWRAVEPRA
ncbi:hypothetical protein [Saccharopolyspora sp. NPDC002376]